MQKTEIAWTNYSSNPLKYRTADGKVVWACIHKSDGCRFCYSEKIALRFKRGAEFTAQNMKGLKPFLDEKELHKMLTYKPASGKMCFLGDMTDIAGEWVPMGLVMQLFAVFALRGNVQWQLLTKRPERLRDMLTANGVHEWVLESARKIGAGTIFPTLQWPLPNVWLGVSCENQDTADERIPLLLQTPAAVRFVSYEPALGPVDFRPYLVRTGLDPDGCPEIQSWLLRWLIIGGESGPNARPFNLQWARDAIAQCRAVEVPCFMKQAGARPELTRYTETDYGTEFFKLHGNKTIRLKDPKGGDPQEWPEDLRVREFPR